MSEEITQKPNEQNQIGELSKGSNQESHNEKENIKIYLTQIENLKNDLSKTQAENEKFESEKIKNAKLFKQNFINFINNNKENLKKTHKESKFNEYFDSDNLPVDNFFEQFNEQYFSSLISQVEDKNTELRKQQNECEDFHAHNKKLLEEINALKNELETSNKKFTLVKEKYEESLKVKIILEKEKKDLSQTNESLEKKIEELNNIKKTLNKEIQDGLDKVKAFEEKLNQKVQEQNEQELKNLKSLVNESNKLLVLEKTNNAELEAKIKENESVIHALEEKLSVHDREFKELRDQLENSKKLIDKENSEVENLIKVKEQFEVDAYKNSGLIKELKDKILSCESELESTKAVNETQGKDDLENLRCEKNSLESQLEKLSSEKINLITDVDRLKNLVNELNQEIENHKLSNSRLLTEINESTTQSLDEIKNESKELNNKIKEQAEAIEINKQLTSKLESSLLENDNQIKEMNKEIQEKDSLIKSAGSEFKGIFQAESYYLKKEIESLKQEIDLLKEENVNLNLTIQEKNEIIINLQNKANEIEEACNLKIEIAEEETNKKLLEMDLQIQDLRDKVIQNAESSREDEKVNILNSKYVDLKEKCSDFVGILQCELKDFEFYVDKRLVINFLFKYFDKNSNEKLKYSLLETLANLLSFDSDDRRKLNLTTLNNNQFSSNHNNNVMTDIESIPFIISKFNEYLENIHFE